MFEGAAAVAGPWVKGPQAEFRKNHKPINSDRILTIAAYITDGMHGGTEQRNPR